MKGQLDGVHWNWPEDGCGLYVAGAIAGMFVLWLAAKVLVVLL